MAHQNIIELNGKHYDTLTGKIVRQNRAKGANLDGFSVRPRPARTTVKHPAAGIHTKTQPSKTLMRKSVQKPQPIIKQNGGEHHSSHQTSIKSAVASPNHIFGSDRFNRAGQIPKSKLISKFGSGISRTAGKTAVQPLPVTSAPAVDTAGRTAAQSAPAPFQKALDHATSHKQAKLKKPRIHHRVAKKLRVSPRIVSVSSAALAVLLIGGFIAYQNVPNLAMRVASARAGVHASLPGYEPAGFGFTGPIQYKPGQITINFKSNSDQERNFSITQSASQWNSQTLLQNYIMPMGKSYQTYEDKGKTIYIYNGSNATWVDGGIWYNVQGNASLNSDQLLRIADSI